ncbi:hypothetical protein MMC11_008155 [Xylographa trunciseda]|nr:hypothetical protein [Xylographa trunciseda]
MTNALFDLASSPMFNEYWTDLRKEVDRVLTEEDEFWTHRGITIMVRMDRTIKESFHMGVVVSRGLMKKVIATEGARLRGDVRLPYRVQVGVSSNPTQRDRSIYLDPGTYNVFRFCKSGVASSESGNKKHGSGSIREAISAPARDIYSPFVKTKERPSVTDGMHSEHVLR